MVGRRKEVRARSQASVITEFWAISLYSILSHNTRLSLQDLRGGGISTAINGHGFPSPLDEERASISPHPWVVSFSGALRCVSSWQFEHHQLPRLTAQIWPALGPMSESSPRSCDGEGYSRTGGDHKI